LRSPAKSVDVEDKFSTKPTFMRRRIGYSANPNSKPWQRIEENTALRAALGFPCSARVTVEEKEPLEKDAVPSASKVRKVLKKPATKAAPLDQESRWLKLRKTNANTGRIRSYITGCKAKRGKMALIVEVPQSWSSQYSDIADKITQELRTNNISKKEALEMRDKLCKEFQ